MTAAHPRIARSTLINLAGATVSSALMFVTIPIYLHLIGLARYGVLAIVWLLLGYFGVFDLGFGRAVANRIAALHDATAEDRQGVFWTGLVISAITGLIGGAILYLLGDWLFAHVFRISGSLRIETENAMPWLALALPLAIIISLLAGALEGRQAFKALNGAQIFGTVLFQIFPLIAAYGGWISLPYLIASAIIGRLLGAFLLFALVYLLIPLSPRPFLALDQVKPLLRYGGWITVTGLISPLLTVFDRFFIGAQLGMVTVATYTVPFNLVMRLSILPSSLQNALFPRFAMIRLAEADQLLARSVILLGALMTPIVTIGILCIKPFLVLWVGAELAEKASPVGQILLLGLWINTLAFIPFAYLQARGRPDLPAKFHALEILPFIGVLWLLISRFGVTGAAWAWDIRVLADTLLLFFAARTMSVMGKMMIGIVPLFVAFMVVSEIHYASVLYVVIAMAVVCISIGLSFICIPRDLRISMLQRLLLRGRQLVRLTASIEKDGN